MAITLVAANSCAEQLPELQEELGLVRCLVPTDLRTKVSQGQIVEFNWTATQGADQFELELYRDELMTDLYTKYDIKVDEIPYVLDLGADNTYYARVRGVDAENVLEPSKWADFGKIATTTVKSYLYPKVVDRTSTSLTISWTADPEVERVEYKVRGSEESTSVALTADQISTAVATVSELAPSTNYVVSIWYKSASRGELDLWTMPDMTGMTEVSDAASLLAAFAGGAPKIFVKASESPYEIGAVDLKTGVEVYGEETAEGVRPVLYGEFHIADDYDGKAIRFESVELNGMGEKYGFAMQLKNGGTKDKTVESIVFKNCNITAYSKGLMYEWGKTLTTDKLEWDGCAIYDINKTGTSGDGIDLRAASAIGVLNVVNNTIYNSFRSVIRMDNPVKVGDLNVTNNTMMNLSPIENKDNQGILGLKNSPDAVNFKNNILLNMAGHAVLVGATSTVEAEKLKFANNHYFGIAEESVFFTETFTKDNAIASGGSVLAADPCYNSKGLNFSLVNVDLVVAKVGASKWWTPFVAEVEDLALNVLDGAKTWDFTDAKYFVGTVENHKVRDGLYLAAEESKLKFVDGKMQFTAATITSSVGFPQDGYVVFKVSEPGSVYLKASDATDASHIVVATALPGAKNVTVKGGAAANVHNTTAQKILISDITEETMVYVYATGPISLESLAWALDVAQVNTALSAPVPEAAPASFTAGEATDVSITWKPVENAGSYSVVFNKKSSVVEASDAPSFVIEGKTTGMLDAGSYKVEVYANPAEGDIYNTMSNAGAAAFAVLPKADAGEDDKFVVTDADALKAAIDAGKTEIYLAAGTYDLAESLEIMAPLTLIGQGDVIINGAFKLSGEVGIFKTSNITFVDTIGAGCFLTLVEGGVTASEVVMESTNLDGFAKSVIYGNYDTANIDKIVIDGVQIRNFGTGQGIFDLRKGVYGSIIVRNSTINGGRDFLRVDANCAVGEILVMHNTFNAVNIGGDTKGILNVRAAVLDYKVVGNLFLNETGAKTYLAASDRKVPYMARNFFYNCTGDGFWTGTITQEVGTGNNGVVLAADPVKDAANGDFTLTSALAMSCRVGAPKWNPSYAAGDNTCFVVTSADEFQAAIDAGKTDIKFAASGSPYDLSASSIKISQPMHINGEVVDGKYPVVNITQIDLSGEIGNLLIENISFVGDENNNFINVASAINAKQIIVRNCTVEKIKKSLYYHNKDIPSSIASVVFRNVMAKEFGNGQGTIDIRGGEHTNISVENCTIIGGRDFIRADKGFVTGGINLDNNLFDGVTLDNGNGVLYVRSEGITYNLRRNLFLNENGANNLLSKTSGVTIPEMSGNYFYNCTSEQFFTGLITQEVATANGGVILSNDPCKDAANGDYTLVDALCLSSNVGPARWNPNAGRVTTDFTASNLDELISALDAGKTSISLNAGTYDFTSAPETATAFSGGVLTLNAGTVLKGISKAGVDPEIIGGIKLGEGVTHFTAQNIKFNGKESAIGTAFEISAVINADKVLVRDCEVFGYGKSLFYNKVADVNVGVLTLDRLLVHDMGAGQGMIDIRQPLIGAVVIENSTFYNGGRDFIRLDKAGLQSVKSASIRNNTFSCVSVDAEYSILYVRAEGIDGKYTVENNLFLNEGGSTTVLAKSGSKVPTMNNNWFFNCTSEAFWSGAIDQATAAVGGGVLEADPCTASAEGKFKLTNLDLKKAKVGDPRWW